jgi:hypothetical protein
MAPIIRSSRSESKDFGVLGVVSSELMGSGRRCAAAGVHHFLLDGVD